MAMALASVSAVNHRLRPRSVRSHRPGPRVLAAPSRSSDHRSRMTGDGLQEEVAKRSEGIKVLQVQQT